MRDWKRTDSVEIEKFLGLLLMMRILKTPFIAQYWSRNFLYSTPLLGSVMSRNRFQLQLSMLHSNDNTQQPSRDDPLRDKLFKLRPVVDHLFEHFQLMYSMSQNVCIDESFFTVMEGAPSFQTTHSDKALSFWREVVQVV